MSTPETDRVWAQHQGTTAEFFEAVVIHARRMETDRAALMDALEQTLEAWEGGYKTTECNEPESARQILAAARANFPQS